MTARASWTDADIPDQTGRCIVVTGATNGIGRVAATALAARGADLLLTGRDPARGEAAVAAIIARTPGARVRFLRADMARLADVRGLAAAIAAEGHVDVLLNNAGLVGPPRRMTTADGYEMQFGVNYLSHYVLTALLVPALLRAGSPRVVTVASIAHRRARLDFDDLQSERHFQRMRAYAQSKLANLVFALELHRRAKAAGSPLQSVAAHPGVALTNIFAGAGTPTLLLPVLRRVVFPLFAQSETQGALPILYAATSAEAVSGAYYGPQGPREARGPVGPATIAPQAADPAAAARLFAESERITGVAFPALSDALAGAGGGTA